MAKTARKTKPKAERTPEDKERMRLEKLERQENFIKRAEENREKRKKMTPAQKQAYIAKANETRKANTKKLQGDLIFPVRSMRKRLRERLSNIKTNNKYQRRAINTEGAVFATAVIEYLVAEVLELAGECSHECKKKRIVPRHILAAISMDEELATFIPKTVTFSNAGVMPKQIPSFLLKTNVNRKEWNQNWNGVMAKQQIYTKGNYTNTTGSDVNNNSKKEIKVVQ